MREVDRTIEAVNDILDISTDLIEVAISDNCSDDGTWERLLASEIATRPEVVVVRQDKNLGFRGNLKALASIIDSEFVWFLGAGEKIATSSMPEILDFLRSENPSTLVLRGEVANYDRAPAEQGDSPSVDFELLEHGFPYSETISMNIFRTVEVRECLGAPRQYKTSDDSWPHLEIASAAWSKGPVFFQKGRTLVQISENPHGWWFHGANALDIYTDKLTIGLDNPRIRTSPEYARISGIGAALHLFEVRVNGITQSELHYRRFRDLVTPRWRIVVQIIQASPRWMLLIIRNVKRLISRGRLI